MKAKPLIPHKLPVFRARLVLGMLLLGFGALLGRAAWLQTIDKEFLLNQGRVRYERVVSIPAYRGRILDRHGEVLAVSMPVKGIVADPNEADLAPGQVRMLARLLDMSVDELADKLDSERDYVSLKRYVPKEKVEQIVAMKLPGIRTENNYRRFYPDGEVAAHVLGFTGLEDNGLEGVELAFEEQLAGRPGQRRVIKDNRRQIVEDIGGLVPPREGRDVTLSIDSKIQFLAFSALKQAVTDHKAKGGSIVVLDAQTGEVLGLASYPSYNPNDRSRLQPSQVRNRALTDAFEPGSTMKPFSVSMALDRHQVRPDTAIDTAPGCIVISRARICDSHAHGVLSVAQVIQKSSNVGTVKMALNLPPEKMWASLDDLGFGSQTRLGFPGETAGVLRPYKNWREVNQATMSYGHGISVSLMQLAHAYLAFSKDGEIIPVSLTPLDRAPESGRRVFAVETARNMRNMMATVVEEGGTAPLGRVSGYRVGGKTGTAHKLEHGQYVDKYVASFVGLAPIANPRLIVAVMVDEPGTKAYYGGEVAAPVFSKVMAGSLRAMGVQQDMPLTRMQMVSLEKQSGLLPIAYEEAQ